MSEKLSASAVIAELQRQNQILQAVHAELLSARKVASVMSGWITAIGVVIVGPILLTIAFFVFAFVVYVGT